MKNDPIRREKGKFIMEINTRTQGFCNSFGLHDADCEAYELADILRNIANVIEGERTLIEDRIVDSEGTECGSWSRG